MNIGVRVRKKSRKQKKRSIGLRHGLSLRVVIRLLLSLGFVQILCSILFTQSAMACGASAGSGGVAVCNIQVEREKQRNKWHVGAHYGLTSTKLVFTGSSLTKKTRLTQMRQLAAASLQWRTTARFSLRFVAGGLFKSSLKFAEGDSDLQKFEETLSGAALGVGANYLLLKPQGLRPFILLDVALSGVLAQDREQQKYLGSDLRLGTSVGWNIKNLIMPYAIARVFGGPISYKLAGSTVRGTDQYHYQLGVGVALSLAQRFDLYAEGIPLGEKGLTTGLGLSF